MNEWNEGSYKIVISNREERKSTIWKRVKKSKEKRKRIFKKENKKQYGGEGEEKDKKNRGRQIGMSWSGDRQKLVCDKRKTVGG